MKKIILIIVVLLAGIGAYLYFFEPQTLDRVLGREFTPPPSSERTPPRDLKPSPDKTKTGSKAAPAQLDLSGLAGSLYVNGRRVESTEPLNIQQDTAIIAAYHENGDFSHEILEISPGNSYRPGLSLKPSQPAPAWTTFQGNGKRTGHVAAINRSELALQWRLDLGDEVRSSPILLDDAAYFSSENHLLTALDLQERKVAWSEGTRGSTASPIANDAFVFAGNDSGQFAGYRLRDGKMRGFTSLDSYPTSLALISEQAFLAVTGERKVYAIATKKNFRGKLPLKVLWQTRLPELGQATAAPVILEDRAIFQTQAHGLTALALDTGKRLWPQKDPTAGQDLGNDAQISLAFVDASQFLTPTPAANEGVVYALDGQVLIAVRSSDGQPLWRRSLDYQPTSSLALAYGQIFLGAADGIIHAHSTQGGLPVFQTKLGEKPIFASPVLFGDKLLVGTGEGDLVLLHGFTGQILDRDNTLVGNPIVATPAVSSRGILAINQAGLAAFYR